METPPEDLIQQIVLFVDREDPAPEPEGIAAAALASVGAFTAHPAADEWRGWAEGSFAKVVRRADAGTFAKVRAAHPDHALATSGAGQAIAFVPGPSGHVPKKIAKLQVSGTELPRAGDAPRPGRAPESGPGLVVVLNDSLGMSTGKAAAQAAHALFAWVLEAAPARVDGWLRAGRPLSVRRLPAAGFRRAVQGEGAGPLIHDAGRTEIAPGSATACVVAPIRCAD
ncbi:peptidyl-tRNA hydrolase [Arthrobacter sp.]|uniref:peptidyl-tRNA hydrolase n=1 Tax=Arthrobacter sp. TaxID=1667 RepID=UPI003A94CD54